MSRVKISPELDRRLSALPTNGKIHAIVLLDATAGLGVAKRRPTRAQRGKTLQLLQANTEQLLPEIDSILANFSGHRLADQPNALGSLPVEATEAGIRALAASDRVKAIVEDQQVSLLK